MTIGNWLSGLKSRLAHRLARSPEPVARRRRSVQSRIPALVETLEPRRVLSSVSFIGGPISLKWTDAFNWSGGVVPTAADDVTINRPNVVLKGAVNPIKSLTVNAAGTLIISNNTALFVSNGVTDNGKITLGADGTWGEIGFNNSALINNTLSGTGLVEYAGVNAGNGIFATGGGTLNIGASVTVSVGTGFIGNTTGRTVNSGTIQANGLRSMVTLGVGFVNNGTINVTNNDTIAMLGSLENNAAINLGGGTTWGALSFQGNQQVVGLGSINFATTSPGNGIFTNSGVLSLRSNISGASGFLGSANSTILNYGKITLTGGVVSVVGGFTNMLGGAITLQNSVLKPLAAFQNDGIINLGNQTTWGQIFYGATGTLNGTGAVIFGSNPLNGIAGNGTVNIVGNHLSGTAGSLGGTTTGNVVIQSSASLTADGAAGTFRFLGPVTSFGAIKVRNGETLDILGVFTNQTTGILIVESTSILTVDTGATLAVINGTPAQRFNLLGITRLRNNSTLQSMAVDGFGYAPFSNAGIAFLFVDDNAKVTLDVATGATKGTFYVQQVQLGTKATLNLKTGVRLRQGPQYL